MTEKEAKKEDTNDDDDGMTLDERVSWLRERGIEIETPQERKASQVVQAMRQADAYQHQPAIGEGGGEEEEETIYYILIPVDASQPLQELSMSIPTSATTDTNISNNGNTLLLEHLKPKFQEKSDQVDLGLLNQQHPIMASADVQVSEATMRSVAQQGHVETFTLVHPNKSSASMIQLYLDEVGMLKRLPLNHRASDYALRAGFNPPPTFYGNVYMAKLFVSAGSGHFRNASLRLQDVAPDAPWLLEAATTNLQHQLERNRLTGNMDTTQPSVAGTDGAAQQEVDYSWTQTEEELEVRIPLLPVSDNKETVSAKKHVKVRFRPKSMEVLFHDKTLVSLVLFERIDVDAATWTIEETSTTSATTNDEKLKQSVLVVSMEKVEQALWPRIRD